MSQKRVPRELSDNERIYDFLKQVTKLQNAAFFRKPVDVVEYQCANYYNIITNPMDLHTMQIKLIEGSFFQVEST
jgi:hypothetical protein